MSESTDVEIAKQFAEFESNEFIELVTDDGVQLSGYIESITTEQDGLAGVAYQTFNCAIENEKTVSITITHNNIPTDPPCIEFAVVTCGDDDPSYVTIESVDRIEQRNINEYIQ